MAFVQPPDFVLLGSGVGVIGALFEEPKKKTAEPKSKSNGPRSTDQLENVAPKKCRTRIKAAPSPAAAACSSATHCMRRRAHLIALELETSVFVVLFAQPCAGVVVLDLE